MTGTIKSMEAHMAVAVLNTPLGTVKVEFVSNTGFAGALTLPQSEVDRLGLVFLEQTYAILADGTVVRPRVYQAAIRWSTSDVAVAVVVMEGRPLLGTSLLDGNRLTIDFTEFGLVQVTPLST